MGAKKCVGNLSEKRAKEGDPLILCLEQHKSWATFKLCTDRTHPQKHSKALRAELCYKPLGHPAVTY